MEVQRGRTASEQREDQPLNAVFLVQSLFCPHPAAAWTYLLSSLLTRTHTAIMSCPTTSSPGLILTEVHSEGRREMAPPSTSLGSGSRTLLGFLGEVGSSAGRRRGSREMVGINRLRRVSAPPSRNLGSLLGKGWAGQEDLGLLGHSETDLLVLCTIAGFPPLSPPSAPAFRAHLCV